LSALGICDILDERKETMERKILFINLPYHGHVIPTIGLVQELLKAGHQATYLLPYDWADKIAECDADFLGYENKHITTEELTNNDGQGKYMGFLSADTNLRPG